MYFFFYSFLLFFIMKTTRSAKKKKGFLTNFFNNDYIGNEIHEDKHTITKYFIQLILMNPFSSSKYRFKLSQEICLKYCTHSVLFFKKATFIGVSKRKIKRHQNQKINTICCIYFSSIMNQKFHHINVSSCSCVV